MADNRTGKHKKIKRAKKRNKIVEIAKYIVFHVKQRKQAATTTECRNTTLSVKEQDEGNIKW